MTHLRWNLLRRRPRRAAQPLLIALLLAIGLFASVPSLGQEPTDESAATPQSSNETFFESVDVRLVNVDLYVRDKNGDPVRGLTAEDVLVLENGKEVTVSNFEEIEGRRGPDVDPRLQVPAPPAGTTLPPPVESQVDLQPELEPVYLVVYIDNFNIQPFNRNRVFRRLRTFMADEVAEGTKTTIVTYDRSLNVRQPFTDDARILQARLVELEKFTGHRVQLESERRQILEELIDAEQIQDAEWRVRQYAESLLNDVSFSIDAMKEMVGSLAGLDGRKMLLYVSDGVPMIPGQDLYYFVQEKFTDSSTLGEVMNYDASRQFQQLANLANSSDVTFYTIDAAGLRVSSSIGAENSRIERTVSPGFMDSIETSNLQSPLILLARETGGQVIMNTNDVSKGLSKISEDFGTYYSLAYSPPQGADGRYRKIEVKLREKRRGVKVRHRRGYRSKSMATRMSDGTLATLQYGFDSNPLQATLAFGPTENLESDYYGLPVQVTIPIGEMVLVPRENVHEARLRLYVGAMDAEGDLSPVQQIPLMIEVPNEDVERARGQGYLYEMKVQIRGGQHRVVVGVLDEYGGVESFVGGSLWVG